MKEQPNGIIAGELRAELARQGKSRDWLAEKTGMHAMTIQRKIKDPPLRQITVNEIFSFASALNVNAIKLLKPVAEKEVE